MKHKRSTMKYTVSCVALGVLFIASIIPSNAQGMTSTAGPEKADIIYQGDAYVRLNQPFTIACTVGLADEIEWLKDGSPVPTRLAEDMTKSHEDISYTADETSFNTTVMATLSVRRAKAEHAGHYQCNRHSSRHHRLTIVRPDSVKITADFDNFKTFELKSPIILHCNVTLQQAKTDAPLVWSKNGTEILITDETYKDRVQFLSSENKLIIKKTTVSDVGNYTCSLYNRTNIQDTIQVVAKPSVKLPADVTVIEGEKLKLTCQVAGNPKPEVEWVVGNITYKESTERVKLESATNLTGAAVLIIEKAELTDFGDYVCRASNIATTHSDPIVDTAHVRVKDKFAALWPFLGICAEVFILCAIILVYEKRRNKPEMEDSDTDQSPDQKK